MKKRLIIALLVFCAAASAIAADLTIKRDPIRSYEESYIIRNEKGKETGSIRPDILRPGEYRILDSTGEQTGRIRKDVLRKDSMIIEKVEGR